jgi:hypothetical protein
MATVHLTDSGQSFPVDDEIATNDELLKATLRSVIPEIGEPNIKRERKDGQLVVTVVKQAGRKGLLLNTGQGESETELGETVEGGGIGTILLDLGIIRTDGGTQARAAISEETVEEYEQGVRGGDDFPPWWFFTMVRTTGWLMASKGCWPISGLGRAASKRR